MRAKAFAHWTTLLPLMLAALLPGAAAALINVGALETVTAADVEVVGDLAYVADHTGGLLVVDVSDPANPVEIGRLDARSAVTGVAVRGDLAYLTEYWYQGGFEGLRVVDVSNPLAPVESGSLPTPGPAVDVQVGGDLAFVAAAESGLRVIDVSDPSAPVEIGSLPTPYSAMSVTLVGDLAYVADLATGVRIIDVSDPTDPTEIAAYAIPSGTYHVDVVGDLAYVASDVGLYVLDVSDPANPVEVGSPDTQRWATHVQVVGDLAYVAGYYSGVRVIDVSDPFARRELGRLRTPGGPIDIQVVGDLAYVADVQLTGWPPDAPPEGGLRIIDVSNPNAPVELFSERTPEYAEDVEIAGDLAYLVGRWDGVLVFDVSDPTPPVSLGAPYEPLEPSPTCSYCQNWPEDIEIAGQLAWVIGRGYGLRAYDVSDPASPVLLSGVFGPGGRNLEVVGEVAYAVDGYALRTVDVSDPSAPTYIGYLLTPGSEYDVAVVGDIAYIAAWDSGLRVADVSDPSAPVEIGALDGLLDVQTVEVADGVAFLGGAEGGVYIVDVSDPTAPVEIGATRPLHSHNDRDVEIVGDLAYVLGLGVQVFDVSDPTAPRELGTAGSSGRQDLEVVGTLVFLAQGSAGPSVLDFGPEYHTRIGIDIDPRSPANRINLMRRGYVEVAILGSERFDVLDVDAATVAFGPAGAPPVDAAAGRLEDTDADGFEDLVLDFRTEEAGIAFGDTEACILGETWDAVPIGGCDAVDVLGPDFTPPPGCGLGFELVLVLPPLLWWRRVRGRREPN